jgi:thiamine-phosphate pyrophosphorylase
MPFTGKLYPILDVATLHTRGCPVLPAAEALLDAGAQILQYRHKDFWSRRIFDEAQQVSDLCRTRGATFIVNDRADYAKLLGAGLHLGQDDLTPQAARKILGDETLIGYSTHNREQLTAAASEPADYLALGPIFGTSSKRNPDPTVGVGNLKDWRTMTSLPLIAIGGITRQNAREVWSAGADMVAIIGDLYPEMCDPQSIGERFKEWLLLTRT